MLNHKHTSPKSDPVERAYEVEIIDDNEGQCEEVGCNGTIQGLGCYPYGTWAECNTCQAQYD